MPAPKRPHNQPLPPSKRQNGAVEPPDESSMDITNLLRKCSREQHNHISCLEQFLGSQEPRFQRLWQHLDYHMKSEEKRVAIRKSINEQIKYYENEIASQIKKEATLKIIVEEQKEQEDILETIQQKVAEYKGNSLQDAEKIVEIEPNPYGPYEEEMYDALQRIPVVTRNDLEMDSLPKLRKTDFDNIEWPETSRDWTQYSMHWDSDNEEAAECQKLNERIQILEGKLKEAKSNFGEVQSRKHRIKLYDEHRNCVIHADHIRNFEGTELTENLEQLIRESFEKKASIEKLKVDEMFLEASRKKREDLLKSIQQDINTELLKCSVCFEGLTNGEKSERCPQQFGSCGHTVCATCMPQFQARVSPYQWTCHTCRAPSDKVLTNWALMELIKEIPGQPRREVVNAPQAVPIVPAPWRLERRPAIPAPVAPAPAIRLRPLPVAQAAMAPPPRAPLVPAPVAPAPVAPPPRAWAPVAPAPMVPDPVRRAPLAPAPANRLGLHPVAPPPRAWAPVAPYFNRAFPQLPVWWRPVQVPHVFPARWAPPPAFPAVPQNPPLDRDVEEDPVPAPNNGEGDEPEDIHQVAPEDPVTPAPAAEAAPVAEEEIEYIELN